MPDMSALAGMLGGTCACGCRSVNTPFNTPFNPPSQSTLPTHPIIAITLIVQSSLSIHPSNSPYYRNHTYHCPPPFSSTGIGAGGGSSSGAKGGKKGPFRGFEDSEDA